MTWSTLGTDVSIANDRHVHPFIPAKAMTLDRIGVQVTAAIAGSNLRLGIYADGGNLYPSSLIVDAGSVSAATTGPKLVTISVAVTAGTLYWLCCHASANAIQRRTLQQGDAMPLLGFNQPVGVGTPLVAAGWFHNTAFGALPDPFPAGASPYVLGSGVNPCVFVRGT